MYELLDKIESPADIKGFTTEQLRTLCAELRQYIIECCAQNPGHLAASLGAVELIVGVHYVFDTPEDQFVFDVGHQAYAHKVLTGRREAFRTMRTKEGISGFPKRSESPFDAFGVGHSSTSISAALGLAEAARMQQRHEKVVALIGDGAMTGGLAFEGLNNAGASRADLLVILNDNNQSIEGNTGAMHRYLLNITTSQPYNRFKKHIWHLLGDNPFRRFLQRWVRALKSWFVGKPGGALFESLGFRYFGPIDGNDIEEVVRTLRKLHGLEGPRILHCFTVKGKGYAPAEADPVTWHAPGRFDPKTGERLHAPHDKDRYQDVFGEVLCELAEADSRVVGVTPAMAQGCGMNLLAARHPDRFFDVGIEEEHAVTFSAGLAAGGMRPFCNLYSAFAQRAYDQIIHDVALQRLPVVLCFDRAGLVGEDGATHNGAFDLAAYRSIPDITIASPRDEVQLKHLMYTAWKASSGPFIIRYPRGMGEGAPWRETAGQPLEIGRGEILSEGDGSVAILALGPVVNRALEAAKAWPGRVGVADVRFLKPLDTQLLADVAGRYKHLITVEDGCLAGGLFGAVSEWIAANRISVTLEGIGIPDRIVTHARQSEQYAECGIDAAGIAKSLKKVFGE
ncbi:MAG: 1-deoxy-D-xylulose-5-phosphate synthase [Bacteroidales bacterium]|nr:1-deoxy-D-xylulose-5-phosphate synthase [Bacteroidales bacterium]